MSWANTPKPKFNGRKKVSSMRFLFSFSENNCIFNSIDELSKQTRINVEWEETAWRIRLLSDLFGCLEKNWYLKSFEANKRGRELNGMKLCEESVCGPFYSVVREVINYLTSQNKGWTVILYWMVRNCLELV